MFHTHTHTWSREAACEAGCSQLSQTHDILQNFKPALAVRMAHQVAVRPRNVTSLGSDDSMNQESNCSTNFSSFVHESYDSWEPTPCSRRRPPHLRASLDGCFKSPMQQDTTRPEGLQVDPSWRSSMRLECRPWKLAGGLSSWVNGWTINLTPTLHHFTSPSRIISHQASGSTEICAVRGRPCSGQQRASRSPMRPEKTWEYRICETHLPRYLHYLT